MYVYCIYMVLGQTSDGKNHRGQTLDFDKRRTNIGLGQPSD